MNPLISVITVVRNDKDGLVKTANSIAIQKCRDFEWIVVDGCSSDGTLELLRTLDQNNFTWTSELDNGIYDAMNKGISKSNGKYFVFLNAGDLFPNKNTLSLVEKKIVSQNEPDVIFGGAQFIFSNAKSVFRPPKIMENSIWHGLPANHQATYYKHDVIGDLRYDLDYKICGDYYLDVMLYLKGIRAAYIKHPLVMFNVGGLSYQNRIPLFLEPYKIQRDILKKPLYVRILSMSKRLVSTIAMIVLEKVHHLKI